MPLEEITPLMVAVLARVSMLWLTPLRSSPLVKMRPVFAVDALRTKTPGLNVPDEFLKLEGRPGTAQIECDRGGAAAGVIRAEAGRTARELHLARARAQRTSDVGGGFKHSGDQQRID